MLASLNICYLRPNRSVESLILSLFTTPSFAEPLEKMESLGCYYDTDSRALPDGYISVRDQIDWQHPEMTVRRCAYVAHALGYQYFAVQYYGECWAGKDGASTYNKYGQAPEGDCWNGCGASFRNSVYRFTWIRYENSSIAKRRGTKFICILVWLWKFDSRPNEAARRDGSFGFFFLGRKRPAIVKIHSFFLYQATVGRLGNALG